MADAAKKEPAVKVETADKPKRESIVWVVVTDGGEVLTVELNQVRALTVAVKKRAVVVRWPLGVLREDFLAAAIADARGES